MAVLAERQRSDTGSNGSQMVDKGSLSDKKPGRMAVEGRRSSKNGPNCWRCGKPGHVQRNCKEHNSSCAVATIVPNREPPMTVSTQWNFEANLHKEETTQADSQIRSGTIDSTGGKSRPRRPRKGHHQRKERKRLKGGSDPPTNLPLWVKLNFRLGEVPSLVDTVAQFSCIHRDVMQTLLDLDVKAKKSSCRLSCHLANGLWCDVKEMVQLHFCWGHFRGIFSLKYWKVAHFL